MAMQNEAEKRKKVIQIDKLRKGGMLAGIACKQLKVNPGTYYSWKSKLGEQPEIHDASAPVTLPKKSPKKKTVQGQIMVLCGPVDLVVEAARRINP